MALEFRRRIFPKPTQKRLLIAGIILLIAVIALVTVWVVNDYHERLEPTQPTETSEDTPAVYTAADESHCLLILPDLPETRFVLVVSQPAKKRISAVSIPGNAAADNGKPLQTVFKKQGAADTTAAIAAALGIDIPYYIEADGTAVEDYITYLAQGLTVTVDENIAYTDDKVNVHFDAGQLHLTGTQAVSVLKYTGWSDAAKGEALAGEMLSSLLNQYLTEDRGLTADFSRLSNTVKTNLRIDIFHGYRETLLYLARQNKGEICRPFLLEKCVGTSLAAGKEQLQTILK